MSDGDVKAVMEQAPLMELADARPPKFSDEALAVKFTRLYAEELRYCAAWSSWLIWNGATWRPDDTLAAFDRSRAICRSAAADADKDHIKRALASAKTVAAVERLAKADRRIAATSEQWDSDPDLFNTVWAKK